MAAENEKKKKGNGGFNRQKFKPDSDGLKELTEYTESVLSDLGMEQSEILKTMLTVEEAAGSLVQHLGEKAEKAHIYVELISFLGNISIELSADGDEYSPLEFVKTDHIDDNEEMGGDALEIIRGMILKSFAEDFRYRHKNGRNYIRMMLVRSRRTFLYETLGAMIAAVILGIIFAFFMPENINKSLNDILLAPAKTMYMNALKMIVAPVVFFSIISCVSQFSDLSALGRVGAKVFSMYLFTTFVAVGVGIAVFFIFQPGNVDLSTAIASDASAITSQTGAVSIKDTVMGIIPSNIIDPFAKSNMLQLIFIAVLAGISAGLIGKYSQMLKDFFTACNDLFLQITKIIIKVMPIAIFCSIMSMMLTMGVSAILSVLGMMGTFIIGLLVMLVIYGLLLLVVGHLNPVTFYRKYASTMVQVFTLASSNASIPINMEACEKKLGIERRIYALSIPLGATLNMDGACVYNAVFALALAKAYGVEITGGALLSMIIAIVVLSMGAPGIPGSGLICLSVLLVQINVPVEAIGLVMGIDSLCGMFRTMSNAGGDVIAATVVAKSENAINLEIYNSK
ncbi:MAG: cation:dicarboxylase symporter family transporter [Lachnospiraceae bacterium]|nr:cation:dicarboxylase symporter family transporter [Lachnospiraceae bacterium]